MGFDHLPLLVSLFLLFSALLFFVKMNKHAKQQDSPSPPSPPKLPLIGNLHQLGDLPHSTMHSLSKIYGPVMRLHFGKISVIVISSAEAAREVLKVHDLSCCSRPIMAGSKKLSYNYLDMAFSPYSDYWRQIRKFGVLELFSVKRIRSFQFIREEEVDFLIDSISRAASTSTPVDLTEKLFLLTASVTFRIAFGKRFDAGEFGAVKLDEVVHEAEAMLGRFHPSECFPYVGWIFDWFTGLHGRLERIFSTLDNCFQRVIDDHLDPKRTRPEQEDIIDVMLGIDREKAKDDISTPNNDHIKAVLLNVFLGGVDTGAIAMIWAMAELVRNPQTMRKAQEEIRNVVGNKGKVTEMDTDKLHYLKMVVKETLRLHPPVPLLLPRETMSEFKLFGYDIPPKSLIQINAWAIGRDPKSWVNPEDFFPERFADGKIDFKGQNFEFLPFGSGRRICPGMYMGTTTVELALANLLNCFDWNMPDGMKQEDMNLEESVGFSLTLHKKTPLKLIPVNYDHTGSAISV